MRSLAATGPITFRIWLLSLIGCTILILLSIMYVDRPVADFLEAHFRHTFGWVLLNRLLEPLKLVAVSALLFLFWAGLRRVFGYGSQQQWIEKAVICSWAIVWGLATEFVLKQIFGRSWPDPTYIQHHLYGFRFLHASEHWSSFPSGTAIGSTALASTLGILFPRLRAISAVLAVMVCFAVVLCNYHWLSDAIAGAFIGISIGWMSSAQAGPSGEF